MSGPLKIPKMVARVCSTKGHFLSIAVHYLDHCWSGGGGANALYCAVAVAVGCGDYLKAVSGKGNKKKTFKNLDVFACECTVNSSKYFREKIKIMIIKTRAKSFIFKKHAQNIMFIHVDLGKHECIAKKN